MRARVVNLSAATICVASAAACTWLYAHVDLAQISAATHARLRVSGVFLGLAWALTGSLLAWLRPRNAVGWLLLAVGTCQCLSVVASLYGGYGVVLSKPPLPAARWAAWLGSALWVPGLLPLGNVLIALYPDGRLPSKRWRLPVGAVSLGIAMVTLGLLLSQESYDDIATGRSPLAFRPPAWFLIPWATTMALLVVGGTLAIWVMSFARLARARRPERQQLAWLLVVIVVIVGLNFVPGAGVVADSAGHLIPVAVAVGVFRYNLLGIEVVLRRGLVYGTLTALVIVVYFAVTALAGSRLDHGPLPGVAGAALVAVGLAPLRERLQRGVDRFVYGARSDPLGAVTRLGDQLATDEVELLATAVSVVVAAVRAPGAVVRGADGRLLAECGVPAPGPVYALRVGGVDAGSLQVAARTPGEAYTAGDHRLLQALAPQVAVVVRALELAEALEAERDRVVAAIRTERERLRRDLHDGLGPSLSGVRLGLAALDDAQRAGAESTVGELLGRIRAEVDSTVGEVRRIIEGFRPAALDETGLSGALRRHAEAVSARVTIALQVPDLPPLSPAVETAAYRIAQEALTNVVRHAQARRAWLTLDVAGDALTVEIGDDGRWVDIGGGDDRAGVGLASMRQRAESLGGTLAVDSTAAGTTVRATIPLAASPP